MLKRYQSTHLGRGGKKAVKSSLRDDMKHMGKGKKKAKQSARENDGIKWFGEVEYQERKNDHSTSSFELAEK